MNGATFDYLEIINSITIIIKEKFTYNYPLQRLMLLVYNSVLVKH